MPPDEFPDLVHSHNDISHSNPHIDSTLCPANESVVLEPVAPDIAPVRQSSRVHKPPTYLRDYHCNLVAAPLLASASLTSSNDSFAHSQVYCILSLPLFLMISSLLLTKPSPYL